MVQPGGQTVGVIQELVRRGVDAPFRLKNGRAVEAGSASIVNHRRIRSREGCRVKVGEQCLLQANVFFDRSNAALVVGDRTFIGKSTIVIASRVEVGDDVLISWGCTIVDHNSHALGFSERKLDVVQWLRGEKNWDSVIAKPVVIQDKAWIGFNAIVLKGVTIGEGAVVGAASVVTKDVAPWTIVVGNPARVIREIPVNER